jgi:hypothetical protein
MELSLCMGITLRMAAKAPAGSNKVIYKRLNSKG